MQYTHFAKMSEGTGHDQLHHNKFALSREGNLRHGAAGARGGGATLRRVQDLYEWCKRTNGGLCYVPSSLRGL